MHNVKSTTNCLFDNIALLSFYVLPSARLAVYILTIIIVMLYYQLYFSSLVCLAIGFIFSTRFPSAAPGASTKNSDTLAIFSVTGAMAYMKFSYDQSLLGDNHYYILGADRESSVFDIRRAFKSLSKVYHPDKNIGDEVAAARYAKIQNAYEILIDEDSRDIYNRFGTIGVINHNLYDPRRDEIKLISDIAIAYIFWAVVVFIATSPKQNRGSRSWISVAGIVMVVLESMLTFSEPGSRNILSTWIPIANVSEFEVVYTMHSLFPVFIVCACCAAALRYVDTSAATLEVLNHVVVMQERIHCLLNDLRDQVSADVTLDKPVANIDSMRKSIEFCRRDIEQSSKGVAESVDRLHRDVTGQVTSYYWVVLVAMLVGGAFFYE